MPRQLSNTAKAALYAQQTSEVFIMLLTVNHESFSEPIRITNDPGTELPDAGVLGIVSRGD